jgi:hypothetical protein
MSGATEATFWPMSPEPGGNRMVPPFAQKTIDKPGSRVIGVVLVVEKEDTKDYYFLKLSGPDGLVKSQAPALRTAFGADAKAEKPFKLEDADN